MGAKEMEKRLQVAGTLILLGLIVELVSLRWSHPTAFLLFAFVGGALIGLGILFYLYSLLSAASTGASARLSAPSAAQPVPSELKPPASKTG